MEGIFAIGDVCTLKSGMSLPDDIMSANGEIPYIKVAELNWDENTPIITTSDKFVSKAMVGKKMIFPVGTVLFPKRGGAIGTNKKRVTSLPVCADLNIMGVIPGTTVQPKYLFYFFENVDMALLYNGSSIPQINNTDIAPLKIRIPSLDKQQTIVNILDKISTLIFLRKQQLAKLDELVKARFVEMFGDPVCNPYAWETAHLASLGNCKNGMNFHTADSGIEIYCLGVGDFHDLSVISDTAQLSKVSLNEMPSDDYLLMDEDIVFVRSNGNKALVGRSVVVYPHNTPTTFSGFCIRFRKNTESLLTDYLLYVLKTNSIREKMAGRGANIQNLNQQILSELEIPMPPVSLQREFSYFSTQTAKQKLTIQQSLDKLEVLKKALMQEYFTI